MRTKRNYRFSGIIVLFIMILGCDSKTVTEENSFEGLWSLHIMESKDSLTGNWSEWRQGMQGYILYDATENMAVHLTWKGYQDTDIRFPNFVDTISMEALKYLTGSYTYFAKYTVFEDENVVQHHRISHSNPGDWGVTVRRRYTFSGDTLILAPLEEQNSGLRLKWIRRGTGEY